VRDAVGSNAQELAGGVLVGFAWSPNHHQLINRTLLLTVELSWSVHLCLGSTLMVSLASFLLSYLLVPLQQPLGEVK
jgi:hypothetical protein